MAGIRQALIGVVSSTGGTARGEAVQGLAIAGKTGSAQNVDDPTKTHSWFVGFAPADHPKIVVAVLLEFGGHGGHAARLAAAMISHYLKMTPTTMPPTEG
jgi:cell division protein FtsI/penicillin-binding protein 2